MGRSLKRKTGTCGERESRKFFNALSGQPCRRRLRTPTLVFLLTGIFTLVPGAGIFYTAYYLFSGDMPMALSQGFGTFKTAVCIALGIGVSYALPSRLYGWKKNSEVWNEDAYRNA